MHAVTTMSENARRNSWTFNYLLNTFSFMPGSHSCRKSTVARQRRRQM